MWTNDGAAQVWPSQSIELPQYTAGDLHPWPWQKVQGQRHICQYVYRNAVDTISMGELSKLCNLIKGKKYLVRFKNAYRLVFASWWTWPSPTWLPDHMTEIGHLIGHLIYMRRHLVTASQSPPAGIQHSTVARMELDCLSG